MNASQVTNEQIVSHFQVEILDSIYAIDGKGRRKFLTDLRTQFAKEFKKKEFVSKKKYAQTMSKGDNINDVFVALDRQFAEKYGVLMREIQPGLKCESLGFNVYCIVGHNPSNLCVNMDSTTFDRKELENIFSGYSMHKRDAKAGITINKLDVAGLIEVIQKMIDIHEAQ